MSLSKWLFPNNNNNNNNNNLMKPKDTDDHRGGKFIMEQESFYLLSFVSWLHNFEDITHWEYRAGNVGLFAMMSVVFLFSQTLVLFDLAYEENLADYKCQGESARLSVVVCGALVTLIVCLKMLNEERRSLCQRLVLIRHSTENSYYYSFYHIIFGEKRWRACKLLLMSIFQSFREYGVMTFVYVAAIEQLMLFDTILDYIINSVVVLLIAELDELVFLSIKKAELSEGHDHKRASFDEKFIDDEAVGKPEGSIRSQSSDKSEDQPRTIKPFQHPPAVQSKGNIRTQTSSSLMHETDILGDSGLDIENHQTPLLYKTEDGLVSALHSVGGRRDAGRINSEDIEDSRRPSVLYNNYRNNTGPANITEMIALSLSHVEYDVYLTHDYWIVRLNFITMLLPLLNGKITGNNCSEHSVYRVSEIAMFGLFVIRVLLNVYVDLKLQLARGKWKQSIQDCGLAWIPLCLWSLLEHGLPCVGYVALMYYVFVEQLKPTTSSG